MFAKDQSDTDLTGSLGQPGKPAEQKVALIEPPETDLAYARAAAAALLARIGAIASNDSSVPWQNPHTGAGGNITPLATSYSESGAPCRDFLASYVHGDSQVWLQGAACRGTYGKWEVKSLTPFKHG
jgi:hypothetical protein